MRRNRFCFPSHGSIACAAPPHGLERSLANRPTRGWSGAGRTTGLPAPTMPTTGSPSSTRAHSSRDAPCMPTSSDNAPTATGSSRQDRPQLRSSLPTTVPGSTAVSLTHRSRRGAAPLMQATEDDGSPWSYLSASIIRREAAEFGTLWHDSDSTPSRFCPSPTADRRPGRSG